MNFSARHTVRVTLQACIVGNLVLKTIACL